MTTAPRPPVGLLQRTGARRPAGALIAWLCLLAASAHATTAVAADAGTVRVSHARAVASVPGATTGLGYLDLRNEAKADDRLLFAASPVAERVEFHEMTMQGDVMKMRQRAEVTVAAGQSLQFEDEGLHLMFVGLRRPLVAGQTFPLTLRFARAGSVQTQVEVQPRGKGGQAGMAMPAMPDHVH